jgi:4-hydroxybenzoate polyprenyltransferase
MRDIKGDKKSGIKTLPILLGVDKTKMLLYSINSIFALFILLSVLLELTSKLGYFLFLSTFYTFTYIYLFNRYYKNRYLFEIIADGKPIVVLFLVLVGSMLV